MDTTKLHIHVRLIQILSTPQQTTRQLRRSTNRQLLYLAFQFEPPNDPARNTTITSDYLPHTGQSLPFKLPEGAADWCMPPALPPLDYQHCDPSSPVNRIPLSGGLTNGLKMILLAVIDSYESGRCFYIDESASHLKVYDEDRRKSHSIIRRYFEHIGLHPDSVIVTKCKSRGSRRNQGLGGSLGSGRKAPHPGIHAVHPVLGRRNDQRSPAQGHYLNAHVETGSSCEKFSMLGIGTAWPPSRLHGI